MENSQLNREKPPRSPTIWGIAVATIVPSMAAKLMVNIKAIRIQSRRIPFMGFLCIFLFLDFWSKVGFCAQCLPFYNGWTLWIYTCSRIDIFQKIQDFPVYYYCLIDRYKMAGIGNDLSFDIRNVLFRQMDRPFGIEYIIITNQDQYRHLQCI